jgi:hypothetical protein
MTSGVEGVNEHGIAHAAVGVNPGRYAEAPHTDRSAHVAMLFAERNGASGDAIAG